MPALHPQAVKIDGVIEWRKQPFRGEADMSGDRQQVGATNNFSPLTKLKLNHPILALS